MARISINMTKGEVKKEAENQEIIVGIDLGTTNSLVAFMREGKPQAIRQSDNESALVPSIIYFGNENSTKVGNAAHEKLISEPHHTIFSVKRLMGKSYQDVRDYEGFFSYKIMDDGQSESLVKIRVGDKFFTPIELSAKILSELKTRAEKYLGQPIQKAVITVPAYFNDSQRQATRDAGKLAGLEVLRIVNEPTAASLAYGIGLQEDEHKTIAVYDLGGGTFDISILRIEGGIFEVLATNGDTFLGGDDLDRAIVQHWVAEKSLNIKDLQTNRALFQEWRLRAERAKKQLSSQDNFSEIVDNQEFSLTKTQFEQLIQPLVQKTLDCCAKAMKDANLSNAQLDDIVLVGGSTRVPLVKKLVSEFFAKAVNDSMNPDEVVALGAAIQADILAGNEKRMLLLDVTPLSLGIETMGGLMDTILPRNSKIPISVGRSYTTSVDGQKNLKVAVYQGERDLVADNRKLGEFVLRNIPPMPAGIPKIEIQFLLNADGILQVRAKELRSGVEQTVEVKSPYGITDEQMAKMLVESVQNAQQDMQQRALIEARTEAEVVLLATVKFIQQNQAIFSDIELAEVQRLAQLLREATDGTDKDLIHQRMDELNTYAMPLAQRSMDSVIADAMRGKKL